MNESLPQYVPSLPDLLELDTNLMKCKQAPYPRRLHGIEETNNYARKECLGTEKDYFINRNFGRFNSPRTALGFCSIRFKQPVSLQDSVCHIGDWSIAFIKMIP
ncbi:hypothetical protein ACTXT7_010565 [Hymenolepis weldensis]